MSNDTMVTVQGWLGSEPQLREVAGTSVANFRIGCTPRRFNRVRQEWVDGPTQWYGVSAWRVLGEHCKRSLHVGDPVIVHGRLNQRTYDRNGVEVTALEIDAIVVGHDLTRGISSFSKTVGSARRDDRPQPDRPEEPDQQDQGDRRDQRDRGTPPVGDPWAVPQSEESSAQAVAGAA